MELNVEQKRLVQASPGGQGVIKGVAGSGKTTVALHRALFLRKHYCYAQEDCVLLVTYNKTLINYLKYLYREIEEEYKDYYINLFDDEEEKVDIQTIDSIIYQYYKKVGSPDYELLLDKKVAYSILSECISELRKKYKKVNIIDQRNLSFLKDEIEWIKSCNYLELEEYQNADRLGRMSYRNKDTPQRLPKNSETRRAIHELLILYNKKLREKGFIDFKDMALLALMRASKSVDKKYNHIIIDESQDLTRVQLEFIKLLFREEENSSIAFVVDTAQSIYPHSWLVKGRSFTSIGFDMTGKSNSLSKNYRTTTQIAQAAYSLIENDENITECENFVPPALIDRQGFYPILKLFSSSAEEAEYLLNEVKNKLSQGYNMKDIVVISRIRKQFEYIKELLDKENIANHIITNPDADFEVNAIRLLTIHAIKGLEYKVVFIIGLNEGVVPYVSYTDYEDQSIQKSNERKLFYVGMTRAKEILYLSCSGRPSSFLKDINPDFLCLKPGCNVRSFYKIKLDNYLFKDQIFDLYSREEEVRQWMISELLNTYGYPQELIDVEYKVSNFSQVGLIDIVIYIFHKGKRIPFIFIEIKAFGEGVKKGLEQLKSYMSNSKTCRYGIITDGNEFLVINKDFEEIEDVPSFHPAMLSSEGQLYYYFDLKKHQEYNIVKSSESDYILIDRGSQRTEYYHHDIIKAPLFNNVKAGDLSFMDDKAEDTFSLPDWFREKKVFIIKVRGDSMKDAGILEGDYVIVEQRINAQNRDIVIVAINDEATIKRYIVMGNTVLLIPENEKYEPIQISDDQACILGVVVGVIRAKK